MTTQADPLKGIQFHSAVYGKARCEIGWSWRPPPLSDYDLWYVVAGSGELQLQDASYRLHKGSCALLRPGDRPHAEQKPDDRLTVIFIHFTIERTEPDEGGHSFQPPPGYTEIEDVYTFEQLLNRSLEVLDRSERWHEVEFDCIMKQLFLQLYRANSDHRESSVSHKQRRVVERVSALIREEGGRRIAHDKLAAEVELSPQYLSALFRKCTGVSLKQYITQVRLERAMHLLMETTMNVSQVAEALGYANVYLFSKQFKQKFGFPPSSFSMRAMPSTPHRK